jgi:hypothetical protein
MRHKVINDIVADAYRAGVAKKSDFGVGMVRPAVNEWRQRSGDFPRWVNGVSGFERLCLLIDEFVSGVHSCECE